MTHSVSTDLKNKRFTDFVFSLDGTEDDASGDSELGETS